MADPVVLSWDLTTRADRGDSWSMLADTDRFNRAAGFGFRYQDRPRPDGSVERLGRATRFGLQLVWEELPWDYRAPEFYRVERRFRGGPLEKLNVDVRFEDTAEGGTRIRYKVQLHPSGMLTRPVILLDAQLSVKPTLDRALRAAIATLDGQPARFDPTVPPLAAAAQARVDAACRALPPPVGERLGELLARGPLREQDRIRPLALAARWGATDEQAVLACLSAVRAGILALRWDLLCPSCRAPRAELQQLVDEPGSFHCPACNVGFDATFPDAIEATFRPAPGVRQFELPAECLSSPTQVPQVVAQLLLPAGADATLTATVPDGSWKLHTRGIAGSAILEVVHGAPAEVAVDVDRDGPWPVALQVAPGEIKIHLRSRVQRPLTVVLEDRFVPADALTAARLLSTPGARSLLPPESVGTGVASEVSRAVLVVVEGARREPVASRLEGARSLAEADGVLFAVFDDVAPAIATAIALTDDNQRSACVHVGGVVDRGPGVPPVGPAVQDALQALRRAGLGRVVLPTSAMLDGELKRLIAADPRLSVRNAPRGVSVLDVKRSAPPKRKSADPTLIAGQYRVTECLARGGHGEVWAATDAQGTPLAVKLMRPDVDDPEAVQRFWLEARILSRLRDPRLVRLYDYGQGEDGRLFLVMERLIGRTLEEERGDGRLPVDRVRALGADLLDALAVAHDAGVLHRDLKPSNIWVGADGRARLLDFGIAQRLGDRDPFEEGRVLGTPRYMAPEQLQARPLDVRTDIFAAGIVLYELVAGGLPWSGSNATAEVMRRIAVPARPLLELDPGVPADLAATIQRALATELEDRWPDARSFRAALLA